MISKNLVPVIVYPGDNITSLFGIPFPTFEAESLKIFLNLLIDGSEVAITQDVDYMLKDLNVNGVEASLQLIDSGQAWINGGNLDVQYSLTVEFDSQSFQPASFRSWTNSSPITLEQTLDRLTMSLKAMNYQLSLLNSTQTDANTAAILVLQADMNAVQLDILALYVEIARIDAVIGNIEYDLSDNTVETFDTVLATTDKYAILEYFAERDGFVQYGREIIQKDVALNTFKQSPIERSGNVGVTFGITNAAGTGSLRVITNASGFTGKLNYRLYKFEL